MAFEVGLDVAEHRLAVRLGPCGERLVALRHSAPCERIAGRLGCRRRGRSLALRFPGRDLVMHALTGPVAGLEDRSVLGVIEREGDRPIGKVLAHAGHEAFGQCQGFLGFNRAADLDLELAPFFEPDGRLLDHPAGVVPEEPSELGVAVGLPGNLDLIRGGRGFFPGPARFNLRRPAGLVRGPGRWARRRLGHPRPAPRRERAPARDAYSYEQELPD